MQKEPVVRAVDVGRENVKYTARIGVGGTIRCAMFPSMAVPSEEYGHEKPRTGWEVPEGDTIRIPVGDLVYTVGPDVRLCGGSFDANVLQHDGYCETPEYMALTLGALHYMQVERIDLLVVGLPVATMKFPEMVQALEKRLKGVHKRAAGRTVHVGRVQTVAQPSGALMYYGVKSGRRDTLREQKSLVIDVGSRTFDWVVTQGFRQIVLRSHSIPRGMFDVVRTIAEAISRNLNVEYRDYEAIDQCLRNGMPLTIFQKAYPLDRHLALARKIATQAVSEMLQRIGQATDIQNIILVGGGAFFFYFAIAAAFPNHEVVRLKNSVFANVYGFQIAGMQAAGIPASADGEVADTSEA